MAYTEVTYTPPNVFAGNSDVTVVSGTVPANTAVLPYAPLKRDANKLLVPATALTDVVIGILMPDTDGNGVANTAGTKKVNYYKSGDFWASAVNFTAIAAADTNDKKQSLFDLTGINLRF